MIKIDKKSVIISLIAIFFAGIFIFHGVANAQSPTDPSLGLDSSDPEDANAIEYYNSQKVAPSIAGCTPTTMPVCDMYDCSAVILALQQETKCIAEAEKKNAQLQNDELWKEYKQKVKDDLRKKMFLTALAGAFKTSLSTFSKTLARDTATWVASGGKGQQPLFATEGWGAYLQNVGDSALGDFLDQMGQRYGQDLCRPDLGARLLIETDINWKQPRKVRCSFSTMMTNWSSAIKRADFSMQYTNALRPGENDISTYLTLKSQSAAYVNSKIKTAENELVANAGFKDVKDFAGKVLTPGTTVREMLHSAWVDPDNVGKKDGIFTGTIFDFVETFLNTLMGQLLNNFKNGLFTSGSNNNGSNGSGFALPLLNPLASPNYEGVAGAEQRFSKLQDFTFKEGGSYDILTKLAQCSDDISGNPGPTDCVIDQKLLSAIKEKKQLYEILDGSSSDNTSGIGYRLFAPAIGATNNLEREIPLRSIIVLRKYRIVPVGWEIAARIISSKQQAGQQKNYTLKDVSGYFNDSGSEFYQLVDPYWTLKAPEVYCRRQGYGGYNSAQSSQDNTMSRSEYCADEQQCLQLDGDGNCQAYGYCTEERKIWAFDKTCEPKYNTCQTFSDSSNNKHSYLTNTLDFRNCTAQNAGCRWYSMLLDPVNNIWRHLAPNEVSGSSVVDNPLSTFNAGASKVVQKWHQWSTDKTLKMSQPCSPASCDNTSSTNCTYNNVTGQCTFFQNSCTSTPNSSGCYLEQCLEDTSILATRNGDLEKVGAYDWIPAGWNFDNASYDIYNRFYRVDKEGRPKNANQKSHALRVVANNAPVIAEDYSAWVTIDDITVEQNKNYEFKFYARGNYLSGNYFSNGALNNGSIIVSVIRGSEKEDFPLYALNPDWKEYVWDFNSGNYSSTTIKIRIKAGTTIDAYFDDFEIRKIKEDCGKNSIWLSNEPSQTSEATDNEIYLTKNAPTCDSSADGCSQFIRTKAGLGSNLIPNSGFEDGTDPWMKDGSVGTAVSSTRSDVIKHSGTYSLGLQSNSSDYGVMEIRKADNPITLKKDSKYILSAWVYVASTNAATNGGSISLVTSGPSMIATATFDPEKISQWQRVEVPFIADRNYNGDEFDVRLISGMQGIWAYFDDVKLEEVNYNTNSASDYTAYNPSTRPASQLAYLKYAPDYLNCYKSATSTWANSDNLYNILSNQSVACSKYAPVCTAEEVGCEIYKPTSGDPQVPGVAETLDLCPSECSGYQVYKQEATDFELSRYAQFIANKTPKYCSAAYAGCDEFTNLDELGRGAEKKEYYVHIKSCQKPSTDDGTYYTWEGQDTTGYQLKVYKLKRSNIDSGSAPCTNLTYPTSTTSIGQGVCRDDSDNSGICTKENMATDPDCRQFYDPAGHITYRLLSKTVSVSDDCHPYRRTLKEGAPTDSYENCSRSHGWWSNNNECVYMAIPGEGSTCSAQVAGCRAYTGNYGNNVRNVFTMSDFTNNDLQGWLDKDATTTGVAISPESTYQGGTSIKNIASINNKIQKGVSLYQNRTYMLSFWAKSDDPSLRFTSVRFSSSPNSESNFFATASNDGDPVLSRINITNEWKLYEVGPVFVNWNIDPDVNQYLEFNLPSGKTVYLDNILLKEVRDSIYLLENSWFTPISCDNNIDDATGQTTYQKSAGDVNVCTDQGAGSDTHRCVPGQMLGCKAYTMRDNKTAYLKSFASLCRAEAAGCEKLVDTHNYDNYNGTIFNFNNSASVQEDQIVVPKYDTVYLVNNSKYSCDSGNKGCMSLGLPTINQFDEVTGYSTVYLRNDPDRYPTDLCKLNEVWCDQFAGSNSLYYFKNPRNKLCEFKSGSGNTAGWYMQGTDQKCAVTADQTFGTGYEALSNKLQPIGPYNPLTGGATTVDTIGNALTYGGWAGVCPATKSGCTEYVDPLYDIYPNLNYKNRATITLDPNYLYSTDNPNGIVTSTGSMPCSIFHPFSTTTPGSFYVKAANGKDNLCEISLIPNSTVVTRAGVYYAINSENDRSSCGGMVDYKTGCVLFNERGGLDYSYTTNSADTLLKERNKYLTFSSANTYSFYNAQNKLPQKANVSDPKDSSVLLKVLPDRTCKDWLYCTSYQKNDSNSTTTGSLGYKFQNTDTCLGIDVCEKMDYDTGICAFFPETDNKIVSTSSSNFTYLTGYSVPGYLPLDKMEEVGQAATVVNGNFESVYKNTPKAPLGWGLADMSDDSAIDPLLLTALNIIQAYFAKNPVDVSDLAKTVNDIISPVLGSTPNKDTVLAKISTEISALTRPYSVAQIINIIKAVLFAPRGTDNSDKFSAVSDYNNAPEGVGYLKVNSAHRVKSESFDVDSDASMSGGYILTGWINTRDLKPSSSRAFILFREEDSDGNAIRPFSNSVNVNINGSTTVWQKFDDLSLDAGMPWKKVSHQLALDRKTRSVSLLLANCLDSGVTCDFNTLVVTSDNSLSGYSYFDNIDMKPELKANDNEKISRDCRIYPNNDSRSCKYIENYQWYSGWYGYCLARDPNNSKVCLQWWPIDQIKGEMGDEVTGYTGMAPLYQCLNAKIKGDVKFGMLDLNSNNNGITQTQAGGAVSYNIPSDNKYILGVCGVYIDNGVDKSKYSHTYTGASGQQYIASNAVEFTIPGMDNEIRISCGFNSKLGSTQAIKKMISASLNALQGAPVVGPIVSGVFNVVNNILGLHADNLADLLNNLLSNTTDTRRGGLDVDISEINLLGDASPLNAIVSPIFESLKNSLLCDQGICPIPEAIKAVKFNCVSGDTGAGDASGGECDFWPFAITYFYFDDVTVGCEQMINTVNSAGSNKAYASRVQEGSVYQLNIDYSSKGIPYNYLYSTYHNPFGAFVALSGTPDIWDGGSADGIQPAYMSYFSVGSKSLVSGTAYNFSYDLDPALDAFVGQCSVSKAICMTNFVGSSDVSKCPLSNDICLTLNQLYASDKERIRTVGSSGSIVSSTAIIKNIFAKSYSRYEYVDEASGYRQIDGGTWSLPTEWCNGGTGVGPRSNDKGYCIINPTINNIRMNGTSISDPINVKEKQAIRFEFNAAPDPDQSPIVSYTVNWGDGEQSSVSGVTLKSRTNYNYPFVLYHYYDIARIMSSGQANCSASNSCELGLSIKIRDNWNASSTKSFNIKVNSTD